MLTDPVSASCAVALLNNPARELSRIILLMKMGNKEAIKKELTEKWY
jgi:hypothetical protein